ncbi:MAG: hypothetical protein R3E68_14315 [Burkholderiaceae bacterium]
MSRDSQPIMSLNELLDTQTRVAYTVRIATASRAELEQLGDRHGVSHRNLGNSALRQAIKQRLLGRSSER